MFESSIGFIKEDNTIVSISFDSLIYGSESRVTTDLSLNFIDESIPSNIILHSDRCFDGI